jgi:hypothetical protein
MGRFNDLITVNKDELSEMIVDGKQSSTTILVECNNVRPLIEAALLATEKIKTHDVYYQPNADFYMDLEIGEITTEEYYKQAFEDYCNYFDKNQVTQITRIIKRLFNYSKNVEELKLIDYPTDKKMILIVENFNFWDLNSQSYFAQLSEKKPNIIVVGQLRSDFDFVLGHIDIGVRSGKGGSTFVSLEF